MMYRFEKLSLTEVQAGISLEKSRAYQEIKQVRAYSLVRKMAFMIPKTITVMVLHINRSNNLRFQLSQLY
ncbi:hypothetical protein [Dolichospermum circinale]|uniref:hypothetical protein n=1 Tax=Dolichospermum circinale TaxID=109265 RepID=UPI00232BEC70|nr:hypothetical protein [Dolichospermum circinale]MDB9474996.1 hypothetical protein [Dolichospermum circinale CS-537/11]